jgi:hypothetical protein
MVEDNNMRLVSRVQQSESDITDITGGWLQGTAADTTPNTLADFQGVGIGVQDFDYDGQATNAVPFGISRFLDAWILSFSMRLAP